MQSEHRLCTALYAAHAADSNDVTVNASDLSQVLSMLPRGINGMVDLPWKVQPPKHMMPIMARARHMWPGTVDCLAAELYDESRSSLTLEFEYEGRTWQGTVSDCCADEHMSDLIREAIAWFVSGKVPGQR